MTMLELSPEEPMDVTLTPLVRSIRDQQPRGDVWVGDGVTVEEKTYFPSVILGRKDITLAQGDAVLVFPSSETRNRMRVARVSYLFKEVSGVGMAHVVWYRRSADTVLGEGMEEEDRKEVFQVTECEDLPLDSVYSKCTVTLRAQPRQEEWREEGGMEDEDMRDEDNFWCRLHYHRDEKTRPEARFEYFQFPTCHGAERERLMFCGCCVVKQEERERFDPRTGETDGGEILSIKWDGAPLRPGDSVYLDPSTVKLRVKRDGAEAGKENSIRKMFEKQDNKDKKEPFKVATIKKIVRFGAGFKLKVSLYYRPEDTHVGDTAAETAYYNQLYHSQTEDLVLLSKVRGRCYVRFLDQSYSEEDQEAWSEAGPERWFFRQSYDPDKGDRYSINMMIMVMTMRIRMTMMMMMMVMTMTIRMIIMTI